MNQKTSHMDSKDYGVHTTSWKKNKKKIKRCVATLRKRQ